MEQRHDGEKGQKKRLEMSVPIPPLEGRQFTREEIRVMVAVAHVWQKRADLRRANLQEADLSQAHLEVAKLETAGIRGAVKRGIYLSQANLQGATSTELQRTRGSMEARQAQSFRGDQLARKRQNFITQYP